LFLHNFEIYFKGTEEQEEEEELKKRKEKKAKQFISTTQRV